MLIGELAKEIAQVLTNGQFELLEGLTAPKYRTFKGIVEGLLLLNLRLLKDNLVLGYF